MLHLTVLQFNVTGGTSGDTETNTYPAITDGYFTVVNSSYFPSTFKVTDTQICLSEHGKFSKTQRTCVYCDESAGSFWVESLDKCVYCPSGLLRTDGTCDWPPPVLTLTLDSVNDPGVTPGNTCNPGTFPNTEHPYFKCSYRYECEGGDVGGGGVVDDSLANPFSFLGEYYGCVYDGNELRYKIVEYDVGWGRQSLSVECKNPEGEVDVKTVYCSP